MSVVVQLGRASFNQMMEQASSQGYWLEGQENLLCSDIRLDPEFCREELTSRWCVGPRRGHGGGESEDD